MAFNIYADENMQTLFAAANGSRRLLHVDSNKTEQVHDFVFYFGNPQAGTKLEAAQEAGTAQIVLSAVSVLAQWQSEALSPERNVIGVDGWLFQAAKSGKNGKNAPNWLKTKGANTSDGEVVWRCLGKSHAPDAVKLALSRDSLASASHRVNLGTSIPSGAAVAVYMQIVNKVEDLYALPAVPQLQLRLSETQEVAA